MKKKFQWWQVNAPFSIRAHDDYDWCSNVLGNPCYTGRWFYESASNKFYFRNKNDAMMFEIMWSGQHESID